MIQMKEETEEHKHNIKLDEENENEESKIGTKHKKWIKKLLEK